MGKAEPSLARDDAKCQVFIIIIIKFISGRCHNIYIKNTEHRKIYKSTRKCFDKMTNDKIIIIIIIIVAWSTQ